MTTLVYPKTEATVVEVVIYKVKQDNSNNFEDILSMARSTIENFPGFIEYKTLRSMSSDMLYIDLVKWDSLKSARLAAKNVERMKDLSPFVAAFEEILIMDHFELFTDDASVPNTKPDLFKTDSNYYNATKEPRLIESGPLNYLSIHGVCAPEDPRFLNAVEAIYSVAFNLKFASKAVGKDFVVAKMEGQWWAESDQPFDQTPRDEWYWSILIRLPDFISSEEVDKAVEEAIHKNNIGLANEVQFSTINEGKSVQILHVGSYADKKTTIDKIITFIDVHGLEINGHHHEIYLSDPRTTPAEKAKTIIRYPVKTVTS